jgi:hypothetical protein
MAKLLNIIFAFLLTFFLGVFQAMFFLGNDETYQRMLETLPTSFIQHALGGIVLGALGSLFLVTINYLALKVIRSKSPAGLKTLFWWTFLSTTAASIIGTIIFFSQ